eukprot:XP_011454430.1 PREDICTED: basic proline-rich protein isoform X3 [Crassostrea gigas]
MNRPPPRKMLPLPDNDAPKTSRQVPPLPQDDNQPAPPLPGRRAPPPLPPTESEKLPPRNPLDRSDSSEYESDSDFDADSDESYEKMRDKLAPPAIPNRGYQQRNGPPSPPSTPRSSRQPPPEPSRGKSSRPPPPLRQLPTLPPIPAGRKGIPQPPVQDDEPEEVYDDGEIGEEPNDIYEDDVEVGPPEDVYDDGEILEEEEYHEPELDMPPPLPAPPKREPPPPPQSSRPPIRPPSPQDVYEVEPDPEPRRPQTIDDDEDDNIYEMEPEVRDEPERSPPQLPSRPAANPPQETYEIEEEQEEYDEFSVEQETYDEFDQGPAEVYEAVSDETPPSIPGRPMPPPPPAVPAPSKHTPPVPRSKGAGPKPTPKPPGGGGPMGIDLSAITNIKLKKVGVPADDRPKPTETDKIYSEEGGVKSAFEKFKQKAPQESGGVGQIDFRSLLSKPKNNIPPQDIGNKPVEKPPPPTPLKPSVNRWGQNKGQGDTNSQEQHPVVSKSLPPVPHKPTEDQHSQTHPGSSSPFPFKSKHSDPLSEIQTPSIRVSPLPDPVPRKEVPMPPRQPSPSPDLPPIPALRRSPSPARDAPPLPPPSKSIPDKPAPAPYSQVKPNTNVSNGTKLGVQEDQQSSGDEDDDIYDDAISNRDPLLGEPWYFKSLKDRKTGDKLLRKVGNDGTFLIRESTKQGHIQPYTMMVLFQNNIYNLKIRVRPDGKMALGEEKPDEMSFMDVQKLVKYHRETDVILVGNTGQHKTLLKCSPPQNAL